MSRLRVGLVQARTPAEPRAALDHLTPLIRQAAAEGAELILTPEASNLLEQRRERRAAVIRPEAEDVAVRGLAALAAELERPILMGSAIVSAEADETEGRAANRSLLFGPDGTVMARYDKLHVFDVDLPTGERHRESAGVRPGDRAVVAALPSLTPHGLGLTICYDVRFPALYRALARAGAGIIAVPAAFTVPTGQAHWQVLLRARAIETGAFILAPAQGGEHEDGRRTYGHSLVVDPWGEVIAALDHDRPEVLMADLDLERIAVARRAIPQLSHERPFAPPEGMVP